MRIAEDHGREILQVHLVDNPGIRRHDAEVLKRGLPPAQQDVALAIALEFEQGIQVERIGGAEVVHLDRVIDDQVGGQQRVGARGIGAHGGKRIAHRREIDHAGHAGEILQQHARGHKADFADSRAFAPRYRLDIARQHALAVLIAQQVLQQDADRERQAADGAHSLFFQTRETEIIVFGIADAQLRRRAKTVLCH